MQKQYLAHIGMLIVISLYIFSLAGCAKPATPTITPTLSPTSASTFTPVITATVPATPTETLPTATQTPQLPSTPTPSTIVTLRIGCLQIPDSLNPFATHNYQADSILSLLYDPLIYHSLDNAYAPALAKSWISLDGGKTWTFHLRNNVKTHDGHTLTAADAAFTLQRYQNHPNFAYYGGYTTTIQTVEAPDAHTLTMTMSQPTGNIEAFVHWVPILPQHIWQGVETSATMNPDSSLLIGSGPFILKEYSPGQRITLGANKDYWLETPKVNAIIFQAYPDDTAMEQALVDGDIDLITAVPIDSVNRLKADPHVQVISGPRAHLHVLAFNVSQTAQSTGHPALQDPQVRLAIAQAIDKQQLIDSVLQGQGMPGLSIIPPALRRWFNFEIEDVAFDLQAAQQTLDNAGYVDSDGNGLRETPDSNKPLSFRLLIPSNSSAAAREAEMIKNWLQQIGIEIKLQVLDLAALKAACCPAFDYDMLLRDQESGPDPGFLLSLLTSAQVASGLNETGYSNPAYDSLYEQQATIIDQKQRRQFVWQMQEMAFHDRPYIVLYYDLAIQAFRKDRFQNWLFVPNGILSLADARSLLRVEPIQ